MVSMECKNCGNEIILDRSQANVLVMDGERFAIKCPRCRFKHSLDDVIRDRGFQRAYPLERVIQDREFTWTEGRSASPSRSLEFDEEERKNLYNGSVRVSSIIFLLFLGFVSMTGIIPWDTLSFGFVVLIFFASRGADILTTVFGLALGAVETNPLSDPHSISNLMGIHVLQISLLVLISYGLGFIYVIPIIGPFLGPLSIWLKNGLLLLIAMMGYRAALSNITQFLSGPSTSMAELKGKFLKNAFICSIIICVIALFISPYIFSWNGYFHI